MTGPRDSVTRVAKALVEARSVRGVSAAPATARLHRTFGKLIGQGGFEVLLERSLVLARREHPLVIGVVAGPSGELTGLNHSGCDPEAIEQAEVAIVAHFIELLIVLIGEELALRILAESVSDARG